MEIVLSRISWIPESSRVAKRPDDLRRRLGRRDLRRVERVGLDEDHFALGDGLVNLPLRMPARVLQDCVHPLVVVKPRQVFRGGDEDREERPAERRGTHVDDLDPVARPADELVVLDEPVPVGELPVRTHAVSEELLRIGNLGGGLGGEAAKGEDARKRESAKAGDGAAECGPKSGSGGHTGTKNTAARPAARTPRRGFGTVLLRHCGGRLAPLRGAVPV